MAGRHIVTQKDCDAAAAERLLRVPARTSRRAWSGLVVPSPALALRGIARAPAVSRKPPRAKGGLASPRCDAEPPTPPHSATLLGSPQCALMVACCGEWCDTPGTLV